MTAALPIPKPPLLFKIIAQCETTRARSAVMSLPHADVETPVFMPVGTQGTLKGILPEQLEALNCQIMLANTYHLGNRPGTKIIEEAGGLHKFMNWNRALLTDSGGFQMVSLLSLAEITEEGVRFQSPYSNGQECMLTPERSINIQNIIGADIIMQLDDVVATTRTGPRVVEATHRTSRWLERCLKAHKNPETQNIFPIVQGNLDVALREISIKKHMEANVRGFAIGGLSGGESKDEFWKIVHFCTTHLPKNKPRYLMGVGFTVDLVVCSALGVDMFDCVFPTRTARFGCALVRTGQLNLKDRKYAEDFNPLEEDCDCSTCKRYTRAYIHGIATKQTVSCHLLTVHNLAHHLRLMRTIRRHIENQTFPNFVIDFMYDVFKGNYPNWVREALKAVGIDLKETVST